MGGWNDASSGKVYLDVVVTTPDEGLAKELGSTYNQLGVFNLQTMETVPTGGTGENTGNFGDIATRTDKFNDRLTKSWGKSNG